MARAKDQRKVRPGGLRRGLMLYGSTAALAAALMLAEGGVGPAMAQDIGPRISPTTAAQGDFTVPGPTPSPSFEMRSGSLDIISMNRDAVLNWTTYDTAAPGGAQGNSYVNFLPPDAELRFVGNGASFTAINRVFTIPDNASAYRGIAIQGQVTSYLFGDGPNSVGPVGGNIWFFSPGGILATGSASFNVGSLLLSASDLDNFFEQGIARSVDFTGVANPFASVILKPGARVTLTQPGSSFAIVAPTIEQGGDVTVNGSTLYLSAESGNLSFSDAGSVFGSISKDARAGNEIRHLGATGGPASIGTDDFSVLDPQTIEFRTGQDVRVLLSGAIGYAAATDAAFAANGSIVLTAGEVATTGGLTLSSDTSIEAGAVTLSAGAGEMLVMGSDANGAYSLSVAASDATLAAGAGGLIDIDGDVTFETLEGNAVFRIAAAGSAGPNSPGGRIEVGGDLSLNSTLDRVGRSARQGGDIEAGIGDGGSISVGGSLSLLSDGFAMEDDDGVTSAIGGRAVLTMTGANATLRVSDSLTLSARALPFPSNCECYPPGSGSATGGYAALTATGGTIQAGSLNVDASAEAFESFYVRDDAVLDAMGGAALVALGDSTARFSSISVSADAVGANASQGVAGGAAFGGAARFSKGAGGSLAVQGLAVTADALGGEGSNSDGETYSASRGGDAEGGSVAISLGQNAEGLGYLDLSASALAGYGGSAVGFSAESGGDGGNALGGAATLTLAGAGTNLAGVVEGSLDVSAIGGGGGDGEADFDNAVRGGDGGFGGAARGGALSITAAAGAEFTWTSPFGLPSYGGNGGQGGNQTLGNGGPSGIGAGGRGGDAIGATVAVTADGGRIAGNLYLDAIGQRGSGGFNGLDLDENFTGIGDSGETTGGSITLTARGAGASRFQVGIAVLDAGGDVSGVIAISDESTEPGAGLGFESLYAAVTGDASSSTPAFRLSSVGNAVSVAGTAEVYANSIALDFVRSGRFEVGGFAFLNSEAGDITITHADNPGVLSLRASGPAEINADGNYSAGAGTVVASEDYALIRATGSLAAADTRSLTSVTVNAEGDVTVGSVSAGADFRLFAGRLEFDGSYAYQPAARATVTGAVTAGGSVLVESGGFAEFAAASSVLSDNNITVRTGDDIIVANGAGLVSNIDSGDAPSLSLLAGDINLGQFSGDLIEPIGTPIASLRIAGSLDANGASLYLSGDAIDASASSISTGNLTVDVTDAPPFGPFSNDGGLLGDLCRQGSACLGSVTATGDAAIGLASNNGLVSLRTGALDFSGDNFAVETLERLELNVDNLPSSLVAGALISLRSVNDAVALTGITLEAPTLELRAATDLAAGSATLTGSENLVVEVGNDLVAGTIVAANGLDDGSDSGGPFTVPGDFIAGSLTYGVGADVLINAGGDLSLGFAEPSGGTIDLRAANALFLGSTAVDSGAIRLDGDSVGFNNLRSSGVVFVSAGDGGISGLSELPRVIDTTSGIALETSGDVEVGDLFAGGDIGISGATVSAAALSAGGSLAVSAQGAGSVGSFDGGGFAVFTGSSFELGNGSAGNFLAVQATDGDVTFGTLESAGVITLQASGALSGGDVIANGALSLLGGSLAVGSAEGGAGIGASIGGDASFTALASASGPVTVVAGGNVTGGVIDAATDVDLSGDSVILDAATAGGDLLVAAFALDANRLAAGNDMTLALEGGAFVGAATAGRDLSLSAGDGGITAEALTAGGALSVISNSPTVIGDGVAGGDLTMSVGILEAARLVAGGAIEIAAAAGATIDQASAGASLAFTGSELTAGDLDAGAALEVEVAQSAAFERFSSGGDAALSGRSLELGNGSVGGSLVAQASEGDLAFTDLEVGGDASLSASGSLLGGAIAASAGAVSLEASGGALLATTVTGSDVRAAALGRLSLGSVDASQSAELTGSSIAFSSVTAGTGAFIESSGGIDGGGVEVGSFASIFASGAITLTGLGASGASVASTDGAVSVTGVAVGGVLDASGTAVTLASPGALQVDAQASAGNIGITAGGELRVDATATGEIALASTGGSVIVGSVRQLDGAPGGIGGQAVSGGGAVSVTAADAISVADSLVAGGALTMRAGGRVSLDGPATGQTIALTAGDLAIGSSGSLGNPGTQRISLASTAPVNLGAGANSGFAVDAAEFARIQSGGDLMVTALAGADNGAGSLTVGSLTVNAGSGGQLGASGVLGLTANGVLDVGSTLSIARAGPGNTLMLTGDAVDLDYTSAQLSVLDTANASTGRIVVNGRLITSMSAAAAADIVGKSPAEIDARLGRADAARDIALFRTASLTLEGRDAILIQNSGGNVADERRGLSVGALTVTGASNGSTLVVLNGIVNNATGNTAAQNVTVTTPIAPDSTVNGCALANISACFAIPEPEPLITPPESILFGTSDLIKNEEQEDEVEDGVADGKTEAPPIDTTRIDDPAGLPMIDDPVTGAGNEDLWQPPEG